MEFIDEILRADVQAPRKQRNTARRIWRRIRQERPEAPVAESKQRTRKMMEYYYADWYHFAVAGTPNRLEYDLGFFVKNGDGSADLTRKGFRQSHVEAR